MRNMLPLCKNNVKSRDKVENCQICVIWNILHLTVIAKTLTGYRLMLTLILAKSLTVDPYNCWPLNMRMSVLAHNVLIHSSSHCTQNKITGSLFRVWGYDSCSSTRLVTRRLNVGFSSCHERRRTHRYHGQQYIFTLLNSPRWLTKRIFYDHVSGYYYSSSCGEGIVLEDAAWLCGPQKGRLVCSLLPLHVGKNVWGPERTKDRDVRHGGSGIERQELFSLDLFTATPSLCHRGKPVELTHFWIN